MQGHYIKTKRVVVFIPEPAYNHLNILAAKSGKTAPGYVRSLINQEFQRLGVPISIDIRDHRKREDL